MKDQELGNEQNQDRNKQTPGSGEQNRQSDQQQQGGQQKKGNNPQNESEDDLNRQRRAS